MRRIFNYSFILTLALMAFQCGKEPEDFPTGYMRDGLQLEVMPFTVGESEFIVQPPDGMPPIQSIAWTGSHLWVLTQTNSDGEQRMMRIDTSDGTIIQSIVPTLPVHGLDYANGLLWDMKNPDYDNSSYLNTFNQHSGAYLGAWNYAAGGDAFLANSFIAWADDSYYMHGEENCDGNQRCRVIYRYDENGQILDSYPGLYIRDLVYDGEYFWSNEGEGYILKLDGALEAVEVYQVSDLEQFGPVYYSGSLDMQLEYFNGQLWIVDRWNRFYRTELE